MSTPAVAGRPNSNILFLYVHEFNIPSKTGEPGLQIINDLLDFLDVFFYILHVTPSSGKIDRSF